MPSGPVTQAATASGKGSPDAASITAPRTSVATEWRHSVPG